MADASLRDVIARVPADRLQALIASLTEQEAEQILFDWRGVWARDAQLAPPGAWNTWVINAGRGFGKTRAGAEFVREKVDLGEWRHVALVGKNPREVRKVMLEGDSGLLAIWPPEMRPTYNPSLATVTFWNGAVASIYSDEVPDVLRGPQHHGAWVDEFAKFRNPRDTWDQLQLGLRLGRHPRAVVTTTPRPLDVYVELLGDPATVVTRGSTYDNIKNLARPFADYIRRRYEGTSLGQQELYADVLADAEGALWTRALIDAGRTSRDKVPTRKTGILGADAKEIWIPDFARVVVGVDPAVSVNPGKADGTGIVVAAKGRDGHAYVLNDLTGFHTPAEWARLVVETTESEGVDCVVGEVNNGGDLVEANVRTWEDDEGKKRGAAVPFKQVRASRGKDVRAEPIKSLYEQRRVHHVGSLGPLEDEMCTWVPGETRKSPDHVDALVWALTELMIQPENNYRVRRFA